MIFVLNTKLINKLENKIFIDNKKKTNVSVLFRLP